MAVRADGTQIEIGKISGVFQVHTRGEVSYKAKKKKYLLFATVAQVNLQTRKGRSRDFANCWGLSWRSTDLFLKTVCATDHFKV